MVAGPIGDLLVGAAHLVGIDLSAADTLFHAVKACECVSLDLSVDGEGVDIDIPRST